MSVQLFFCQKIVQRMHCKAFKLQTSKLNVISEGIPWKSRVSIFWLCMAFNPNTQFIGMRKLRWVEVFVSRIPRFLFCMAWEQSPCLPEHSGKFSWVHQLYLLSALICSVHLSSEDGVVKFLYCWNNGQNRWIVLSLIYTLYVYHKI